MKTIYAESTKPGHAAISIVRISGPNAAAAALAITFQPLPPSRTAAIRRFYNPKTRKPIDKGILIYFRAPNSFTAEDTIELHLHGSPAVAAAMLDALGSIDDIAPAQQGDFTRQAFENGHLNITEVEALADLIAAETELQRQQAWKGLDGALHSLSENWNAQLLSCLAHVEAVIEFPEDDDLGTTEAMHAPREQLRALLAQVDAHLRDARCGERLREGIEIALVGAPNVGKSSLFNALLGRERVLVSPVPGTTRDIIEVRLDLGGYPVTLTDMAGLREGADVLESEGIARARARGSDADIRLIVLTSDLSQDERQESLSMRRDGDVIVLNKCDVLATEDEDPSLLRLSARTGTGMDELMDTLIGAAGELQGREHGIITRTRHRDVVRRFRSGLSEALAELDVTQPDMELAAEGLRLAGRALAYLCDPVDVENVLGALFSEFCIGK